MWNKFLSQRERVLGGLEAAHGVLSAFANSDKIGSCLTTYFGRILVRDVQNFKEGEGMLAFAEFTSAVHPEADIQGVAAGA